MKLETLLKKEGVEFQKSKHAPAFTSQELAAEEHTPGKNVAKPVVVKYDGGFAMCVIPAVARRDFEKVSEVLQAFDVTLGGIAFALLVLLFHLLQ